MADRPLTELLERLLLRLDVDGEVVLGAYEVAEWPAGLLATVTALGLLARGTNANGLVCDECPEACWLEPKQVTGPNGEAVLVSPCRMGLEDVGLLTFSVDRLRTWRLDLEGLAKTLATAGDLRGAATEVVPDRLWRLGTLGAGRARRRVLLAPGLARVSPAKRVEILDRAGAGHSIVLVPSELPQDVMGKHRVVVVPLSEVLEVEDGELLLDLEAIAAPFDGRKRPIKGVPVPHGTDWESVLIRVVDDENVQVVVGSQVEVRSFEDLGMVDRRRSEPSPNETWGFLLTLAKAGGSMTWREDAANDANKKRMSELRRVLRAVTGLSGDPFHAYAPGRGWRPRFGLVDLRDPS